MLKVEKFEDNNGYNSIVISSNKDQFHIMFAHNLDLYFMYTGADYGETDYHMFIVDKDNYFLYKCFFQLYDDIIGEKPMKNDYDTSNRVYPLKYLKNPLVKEGLIEWHSDDGLYDKSAILFIEKSGEVFRITLKDGIISDMKMKTASVRFRNNGSRYDPYNWAFMNFYNNLCNYDFSVDNQITIYEYMKREKIRKR